MEASDGLNPVSSQGYAEVQSVEARAMAGRHPFICIILAGTAALIISFFAAAGQIKGHSVLGVPPAP